MRPGVRHILTELQTRHRRRGGAIAALFEQSAGRFDEFSISACDLLLDFSKTAIDPIAKGGLVDLARAAEVENRRTALFAGEKVNVTEGRAALHMALRAAPGDRYKVDGRDVSAEVDRVRAALGGFAEAVRGGGLAAVGRITDVVNLGIGGSDLGPRMATAALKPYHDGPRVHYVSNVDGADIHDTLAGLDPASTLVVIASKTFSTVETLTNAATARQWLADRLGAGAVGDHLAAVSAAPDKAVAFGVPEGRVFPFWDWVGGRYSLWSAIGLPLAIAIGPRRFDEFLAGGRAMDRHFREAPLDQNLPVWMALVGVWHRNVCGYPALAVLPYEKRLALLPAYLGQLEMESNGKRVDLKGAAIDYPTVPVLWGGSGTDGQHAFHQMLHQGTDVVPAEFLVGATGHESLPGHHDLLIANCLAQSAALMTGRSLAEAGRAMAASGADDAAVKMLAPHRVLPGERPSTTILYPRLTPSVLGQLIALYEHKVFVQGVIWETNPFDQFGVEFGKELATGLKHVVSGSDPANGLDGSTAGLVAALRRLRDS